MNQQKNVHRQVSGGILMGFVLMEIGIVLVLIAQSFGPGYRTGIIWSGVVLLSGGLLLFLRFLTTRESIDLPSDKDA